MNKWQHPTDYGGFSPEGDYVLLVRNRDSGLLENCNFEVAAKQLNAEDHYGRNDELNMRPNVYTWAARHWGFGWVEFLMIRADAPVEIIEQAEAIEAALADYPVLNESEYSNREFLKIQEYWERSSIRDRYRLCKEARISIFAARRDRLPDDDNGHLWEAMRGDLGL